MTSLGSGAHLLQDTEDYHGCKDNHDNAVQSGYAAGIGRSCDGRYSRINAGFQVNADIYEDGREYKAENHLHLSRRPPK